MQDFGNLEKVILCRRSQHATGYIHYSPGLVEDYWKAAPRRQSLRRYPNVHRQLLQRYIRRVDTVGERLGHKSAGFLQQNAELPPFAQYIHVKTALDIQVSPHFQRFHPSTIVERGKTMETDDDFSVGHASTMICCCIKNSAWHMQYHLIVNSLVTWLQYRGGKHSKKTSRLP